MKLLIILPRFPYPTEKGDKLRAFNQIKVLAKHYDIYLFALSHNKISDSDFEKVKPYCKQIIVFRISYISVLINLFSALLKGLPLQVGFYYSNRAKKVVNRLVDKVKPDHIYCQLLRTALYAIDLPVKKTLDYQDVFSKGVDRRIPKTNFFMKIILSIELKRLLRFENYVFDQFDNKTIISLPDRDHIPHPQKDQIEIIPNGVDQDYFKPINANKNFDLIFTGNMSYPPNIDCAEYIVNKVLPEIKKTIPTINLVLAGASPHKRVKALEAEDVKVTGWVDDITEYYAQARVFLAPMQMGTGLQNKLLEAMAMKIPCITSTLCNAALGAEVNSEILIGNTPVEVAENAVKLLQNTELASQVGKKGCDFVTSNYSWEESTNKLACMINETLIKKSGKV